MKITTIAARLRQTAVDMEIMAAMDGDWDFPDELVLPFIINAVTDKRMLERASGRLTEDESREGKLLLRTRKGLARQNPEREICELPLRSDRK